MRLAISTRGQDANSPVDLHFGRTRYFRIVDSDSGEETVLDNAGAANAAQGAGIQTARRLVRLGVQAVLTGSVGPNAWQVLQAAKIRIYSVMDGSVEQVLRSFRDGQLQPITENEVRHL